MAMGAVTLLHIDAFDGRYSKDIDFIVNSGGNQVIKNRVVIRNNVTNAIVYDKTQDTFQYKHTIVANSLNNGFAYNIVVITYDINNNHSADSNKLIFKCYNTPEWRFYNIPTTKQIETPEFDFQIFYSSVELLSSFIVYLYDSNHRELSNSGVIYVNDSSNPLIVNYKFSGFNNNTKYFVRAIGSTIDNMQFDTDYQEINVAYVLPNLYTIIELSLGDGNIRIKSNVKVITGIPKKTPVIYIDDTKVDLRDNSVIFDKFNFNSDFSIKIIGENFTNYAEIFRLASYGVGNSILENITLICMKSKFDLGLEKFYIAMFVEKNADKRMRYYIQSNALDLPVLPDEELSIDIIKKNGLYDLKLEKVV